MIKLAGVVAVWAVAMVVGVTMQNEYWLAVVTATAFYAVWGQSWNIVGGLGGQISLGHSTFIAIAAYVTVIAFQRYHVTPALGLFAGIAAAVVVAAFIGLITLRLDGPYFALATLAVSAVLLSLIVHYNSFTGGANGLGIPFSETNPLKLEFISVRSYYLIAVTLLAAVTAVMLWIRRSRLGYYLLATSNSPAAAEAAGVRASFARLIAFCISAALTAAGGAIYVFYAGFADPNFLAGLQLSISIALIAVVGGRGYLAGPIVGAAFLQGVTALSDAYLGGSGGWNVLVLGAAVVVIVLIEPRGLLEMGHRLRLLVLRRFSVEVT